MFIGRDRSVRQKIVFSCFEDTEKSKVLTYSSRLSRQQWDALWGIVERIGFLHFHQRYEHRPKGYGYSGGNDYHISVRFGKRRKDVTMFEPRRMVEEEQSIEAAGFLELWDAIHQFEMHGKQPKTEQRRPWWGFWN